MKPCLPYLEALNRVKKKIQSPLLRQHQIECTTGEWLDCAVLKLQKKSWTQNGLGEGVFFSVWVGEKELKKNRFHYNVHALKLRLWEGYAIKPLEFASGFRTKLRQSKGQWPNLRTDYGPQTLMQGWVDLYPETFEEIVIHLAGEFVELHGIIDLLIKKGRRPDMGKNSASSKKKTREKP
jgi:hypothetical protein